MIATLGLASLPADSRAWTKRAWCKRLSVPSQAQSVRQSCTVLLGGRSLGKATKPVLSPRLTISSRQRPVPATASAVVSPW